MSKSETRNPKLYQVTEPEREKKKTWENPGSFEGPVLLWSTNGHSIIMIQDALQVRTGFGSYKIYIQIESVTFNISLSHIFSLLLMMYSSFYFAQHLFCKTTLKQF